AGQSIWPGRSATEVVQGFRGTSSAGEKLSRSFIRSQQRDRSRSLEDRHAQLHQTSSIENPRRGCLGIQPPIQSAVANQLNGSARAVSAYAAKVQSVCGDN